MQRTDIEWTDFSWNPILGMCPVDCKLPGGQSYCYARRMYKRFQWMDKLEGVDEEAILMKEYELCEPGKLKKASKIFVCSTIEIFHPEVLKEYRDMIFMVIKDNPQHTFQILTKFPQNIDRDMPDNVWLGVSITRTSEITRWTNLYFHQRANLKFVSFEPLLEQLGFYPSGSDWIIMGRLTSFGNKHQPEKVWIREIVDECKNNEVPVFLKDNLIPIIGKEYVMKYREFPKE